MFAIGFTQLGGQEWPSFFFFLLAGSLVAIILILWRRYQSRRALHRRIARLEALNEAGRSLVSSRLEERALCELIAIEAGKIIDASAFQVGLFQGSQYRIEYWTVEGHHKETPQTLLLDDNGGLVGWVKKSQKPLLVNDFRREINHLPVRPIFLRDIPARSALYLPLISGLDTLGVLAVQSVKPKAFNDHDLRMLSVIANQAGAALGNVRLYQKEKQRAAHLELVGDIAGRISALSDLDELLRQTVNLSRNTFGFDVVSVYTLNQRQDVALLQATSGDEISESMNRVGLSDGVVGRALESRRSALCDPSRPELLNATVQDQTLSEIALPLIVDDRLVGIFYAASCRPDVFSDEDQKVLAALSDQVAIAIHKALQFKRQKEQTWLTTAQLQATEALSQATDIDALTDTLVRLVPMLSGEKRCAVFLWDDEFGHYRGGAQYGYHIDDGLSFQELVLNQGQWRTLDAVHVGQEVLTTNRPLPWQKRPNLEANKGASETLFPLTSQGRTVGVLVTGNDGPPQDPDEFQRKELLTNIVNQASQAIGSIQLFLAQQEEAWVNTALLQVAEAVNQLTDLNEILGTIVRLLPMLVGAQACLILVRDEESGAYHAGPSHGISEMGHGLLASFEVNLSEFPLLGEQDVERLGPDASYYTFKLPPWMHTVMGAETADIFPLYSRAKLVGGLVVGPTENGLPLSGRRLNIVTGIAQQAAIAVTNDRLYKESADRGRIEQELALAYSIQSSLMPEEDPEIPDCSVASFWQAARQVSGDFYDFLPLPNGRWGIAIADVADKGIPAALFMALCRTILRTVAFNRQDPADALRRTNELIVADSKSDLFVTVFYAIWDPSTEILTYANGGHNPPVLIGRDGKTMLLRGKGVALGILPQVEIAKEEVRIKHGETIIFYTDGVTEAMNEDFDEFGMERLILAGTANRHSDANTMIQAITDAVAIHTGETPQFDDITMVVIKRQDTR